MLASAVFDGVCPPVCAQALRRHQRRIGFRGRDRRRSHDPYDDLTSTGRSRIPPRLRACASSVRREPPCLDDLMAKCSGRTRRRSQRHGRSAAVGGNPQATASGTEIRSKELYDIPASVPRACPDACAAADCLLPRATTAGRARRRLSKSCGRRLATWRSSSMCHGPRSSAPERPVSAHLGQSRDRRVFGFSMPVLPRVAPVLKQQLMGIRRPREARLKDFRYPIT